MSFGEDRQTFYDNVERFYNFKKLEEDDRFCFMEMMIAQEEMLAESLKALIERIHILKAKRVVIDSFTAFAQAVKKPIAARFLLHTVLSKIVKRGLHHHICR